MRVLLADDEPIARQVLREQLESFAGVTLVGEASTGGEAVELAQRLRPDLVLLDLQMPELDGFAAARQLSSGSKPLLMFVTAYHQHALQAFETGAVDYLLKPVRRERLAAALEKARAQVPAIPVPLAVPPAAARKIVGRLGSDLHLLDPADVIAFQADQEAVAIIATKGRLLATYTLKALEERLPAPRFRRIHRGTIINTDHIRRISPLSSKRFLLKMSNGMEIVVSKRMAGSIREATEW